VFAHEFVRNAWLAGTAVAAASGLVGWGLVWRGQLFAGDALSHVAFTGAVAAAALGADPRIGLFVACAAMGAAMAGTGRRGAPDDAAIGVSFAWVLGLGALCLALYESSAAAGMPTLGPRTLFGSVFGLSAAEAQLAAVVAVGVAVAMLTMARPLLLCTLDPAVAAARGLPVRRLGIAFLMVAGVQAGEAAQAVGALLLLGLLAAPAASARRLTAAPWPGLALSVGLAVGATWVGLTLAYLLPGLPPSTAIVVVACGGYGAVAGWDGLRGGW